MSTVPLPRYLDKEGGLEWVVGRAVIVGPAVVQRLFIGYYTLIELWAHALLHDSHDSHALATSEAQLEVLFRQLACEFNARAEPVLVIGAMVGDGGHFMVSCCKRTRSVAVGGDQMVCTWLLVRAQWLAGEQSKCCLYVLLPVGHSP